ncbi:SIR2 family protein [Metabacillus indicus]|uniref:SIR2-like domain-containing protein n=1 Tax=Metabacillus indicus TaxID=246786 RepID=A0A084GIL6_METID|nr:SIR2 family protein [Metabacillus indicus]KEZ47178.1 hypothetical protein GS18_0220225 [Metabacillus indicus]
MSPQTLNLNQAIYEIKDALNERDNPFFFIVGAGISFDSVPLAKDIIELCKEKINQGEITFEIDENIKGAEEYSFWLEKAYPQPISRQRFFRELIENKNITSANFRLAHLLAYSKLAKIVVTPNFDDFLTRALNHFNVKHIICDHPESAFKVNSDVNDIQIVHVHGTYLSYDCCNLTPEIIARNKGSELTTNNMASLLERIGESISPIIIGYSGWENDVVMTSLRKRLQSRRLPYKLYWFCYSIDQLDDLPPWLKEHNDVVFVIPEKNIKDMNNDNSEKIDEHFKIDTHDKLVVRNESKLSAHVVFDRLVNALDLQEPEITEDPLSFFIKFLGGDRLDEKAKDVFFLNHVIERLKNLQRLEEESEGKDNQNISLFKNIRGFARRSQYSKAARLLQELNYENFDQKTLLELLQVIFSIINRIDEDIDMNIDKDENTDYQLILKTYDCFEDVVKKAKEKNPKSNLNEVLIIVYERRAYFLNMINDEQNFLQINDKIIDLFSEEVIPQFQVSLARATLNKAISYKDTDITKSLTMFEGIINDFSKDDKEIQPIIRSSLIGLIKIYNDLEDYINAHKFCDYLIEHSSELGEKAEPLGMINKIQILINEKKHHEATLQLQSFESKYSITANEDIQYLLISAIKLLDEDEVEDEYPNSITSQNKIIGLFSESKSKRIQKLVAEAYFERAFYFNKRGDQLTSVTNFLKAFDYGMTLAGVNIFYLIRKREVQKNMIPYTMEELITPRLNDNDPFAIINQALYLIEIDNGNWVEADNLFNRIENTHEELNQLGVISWWHNLSLSGDDEGDLVLAWLLRHNLIEDPNDMSIRDRLVKVREFNIPDFMMNYANQNII